MGKRTVRVDIPQEAEAMITLGTNIRDRHTELAGSSPLNTSILDMTAFAAIHQLAKDKRKEALDDHGFGQAAIQLADRALGRDKTQTIDTPGTVYFYTARMRDQLLLKYQGNEEELSTFGFNVVIGTTGKKKTVRVDIPISNYPDMERLAAKIIERHTDLGAASPLNDAEVTAMEDQLEIEIGKRFAGNQFHNRAEPAMQKSDNALGIGKGQTIETEGTVYYMMNRIRKILLLAYQGVEEEISTFGFNVVVSEGGSTPPPPPPAPASITLITDQTILQAINLKIAGNAFATGTEQFLIAFGDGNETIGTLANGILTSYPHDYNIPGADASGIYTIIITPVTADALVLMDVFQFDNCKLRGTFTIPPTVQPANIEIPMNPLLTAVNMLQASYANVASFVVFGCGLLSINENLIGLDNSGKLNGFANFGGGTNAAPTGAGIIAKNNLTAKGWTVITN